MNDQVRGRPGSDARAGASFSAKSGAARCGPGLIAVAALIGGLICPRPTSGQDAPAPPVPSPTTPAAGVPDADDRLRRVEEENRRLSGQIDALTKRHEEQIQRLLQEVSTLREQGRAGDSGPNRPNQGGDAASGPPAAPTPRPGTAPNVGGAPDLPGGRLSPIPSYNGVSAANAQKKSPLKASFGPGFELLSEDEEFQLQFHQETQLDFKEFDPNGDQFARSGFAFPRVRAFFNGRVGKPWEYTFSINRGLGSLDVLDAYVNYRPNDQTQFKAGRFMTPFNYEQFAVQNMWLIAPERSLFTSNLGLNRMIGAQLWGNAWDKRLDYAVGVFNGPRNSFEDFNESKDVMSYANVRPFGKQEEGSPLRNLNVGGSFTYGSQDNPLTPRAFRTASNASNASAADLFSPPFFVFNSTVLERGQRSFWSAHASYFYKSLSLFADYNGGILRYVSKATAPTSVDIPTGGFSVAAGYFLTGETQERRAVVEPLHPLNLKRGEIGLGAWELAFRFSEMQLDRVAFDAGLSDPEKWTNRAWTTNLGLNWYPTRYIKVYATWQHTEFGNPVLYRSPNAHQLTNELFWLRLQLYF